MKNAALPITVLLLLSCSLNFAQSAFDTQLKLAVQASALEQFDVASTHFTQALALSPDQTSTLLLHSAWADMETDARQFDHAAMHLATADSVSAGSNQQYLLFCQRTALAVAREQLQDWSVIEKATPPLSADSAQLLRLLDTRFRFLLFKADHLALQQLGKTTTDLRERFRQHDPHHYISILFLLAETATGKDRNLYTAQLEKTLNTVSDETRQRWLADWYNLRLRDMIRNHDSADFNTVFDQMMREIDPGRLSHRQAEATAWYLKTSYQLYVGNNQAALVSIRKAMALYSKIPNPGQKFLAHCNLMLGQCYEGMNEPEQAAFYMKKGADYLIATLAPEGRLSPVRQIVGLYGTLNQPVQMRQYLGLYDQTLAALSQPTPVQQFLLGRQWFNYHYNYGSLDSAILYAEQTLHQYGDKVSAFYTKELEVRLSHAFLSKKEYTKSYDLASKLVVYFEKRREQLGPHYATEHYAWMHAVAAYSGWFLYEESRSPEQLQLVIAHTEKAEEALINLRTALKTDRSLRWGTDDILYSSLLVVRQYLFQATGNRQHIERAFQDSEISQMVQFQEFLNTAKAIQFGDLPPEAASEERILLDSIASLQENQSRISIQNTPSKDSLLNELSNQLISLNNQYNALIDRFSTDYPQYYRLKFDPAALTLAQVQSQVLKPGETFLTYQYYDKQMAIMAIRSDSVRFVSIPFEEKEIAGVDSVIAYLNGYPERVRLPEKAYADYLDAFSTRLSHLYQYLIQPVSGFITSDLLIQPCKSLAFLPFETLLSSPVQSNTRLSNWPWLAQQYRISYVGTATVFDAIQRRKAMDNPPFPILTFAPYFDGDTSAFASIDYVGHTRRDFYSPLPHSGEEAFAVAKLLKGQAFTGKDATLERFKRMAGQARILHTATHASGSTALDEPPFIAFQAEKRQWDKSLLFPEQIYPLRINADLVTLSACESGLGKYAETEGLIGLVRAFQCAGARNVTASMWSVNDASTKLFMLLFYKQIKQGAGYSDALARAKREFLATQRQYGHPYYWAGFVLYGR